MSLDSVITIVSGIVVVVGAILGYQWLFLKPKVESAIDRRMEKCNEHREEVVASRLDVIDMKIDQIERTAEDVELRLDTVEAKIDSINDKVNDVKTSVTKLIDIHLNGTS